MSRNEPFLRRERGAEIVIIGGGGHAKVVASILHKLNTYRILGYTDIADKGCFAGIPFLGCDCELSFPRLSERGLNVALGLGQLGLGLARQEVWSRLQSWSLSFPIIVSPDAVVNEGTSVAEGTAILDGAVVNVGAMLGVGVIVNTNGTIEHDAILGDWVHVGPGATICGGVSVGSGSMIGAGATVIQGIKITEDCIVGAGTTVVSDITEAGVYVGNPARRLK